jgi:hypothetical protein
VTDAVGVSVCLLFIIAIIHVSMSNAAVSAVQIISRVYIIDIDVKPE